MAYSVRHFSIQGMTCAACAARLEKVLNRLPNAEANVNFADETAHVRFPDQHPITPNKSPLRLRVLVSLDKNKQTIGRPLPHKNTHHKNSAYCGWHCY